MSWSCPFECDLFHYEQEQNRIAEWERHCESQYDEANERLMRNWVRMHEVSADVLYDMGEAVARAMAEGDDAEVGRILREGIAARNQADIENFTAEYDGKDPLDFVAKWDRYLRDEELRKAEREARRAA